ncbi:hypothetical protein [Granulibacter bethesdensis]|nr:hypothetical protein [Granulibacter bethesdensis]
MSEDAARSATIDLIEQTLRFLQQEHAGMLQDLLVPGESIPLLTLGEASALSEYEIAIADLDAAIAELRQWGRA